MLLHHTSVQIGGLLQTNFQMISSKGRIEKCIERADATGKLYESDSTTKSFSKWSTFMPWNNQMKWPRDLGHAQIGRGNTFITYHGWIHLLKSFGKLEFSKIMAQIQAKSYDRMSWTEYLLTEKKKNQKWISSNTSKSKRPLSNAFHHVHADFRKYILPGLSVKFSSLSCGCQPATFLDTKAKTTRRTTASITSSKCSFKYSKTTAWRPLASSFLATFNLIGRLANICQSTLPGRFPPNLANRSPYGYL